MLQKKEEKIVDLDKIIGKLSHRRLIEINGKKAMIIPKEWFDYWADATDLPIIGIQLLSKGDGAIKLGCPIWDESVVYGCGNCFEED